MLPSSRARPNPTLHSIAEFTVLQAHRVHIPSRVPNPPLAASNYQGAGALLSGLSNWAFWVGESVHARFAHFLPLALSLLFLEPVLGRADGLSPHRFRVNTRAPAYVSSAPAEPSGTDPDTPVAHFPGEPFQGRRFPPLRSGSAHHSIDRSPVPFLNTVEADPLVQ